MKTIRTLTLTLLFVLFTLPAQAANWTQVDKAAGLPPKTTTQNPANAKV